MKVSKVFAEDFDRSFRHMKFEGVIIEKKKHENIKATSTKGVGKGNPEAQPDVSSVRGSRIQTSPPSIPEGQIQASSLRPPKRGRTVYPVPLSNPLRSGDPCTANTVRPITGRPDNRCTIRKTKEPVQAQRAGKHHHCAERGVK